MKRMILALALALLLTAGFALEPEFASDPAISPDGMQVCFVYDNDLWLIPFNGGAAQRLTATDSGEWGPCWSPDGNWIAFNSNREGISYPYLISPLTGETRVIIEEGYTISDWFADSSNILCTRYNQNFGSSFYKVPLDGSRPQLLAEIGDRYASLSPDNASIIFNRDGNPHRESYRGSVAGELWRIDIDTKTYTRLTNTDYTERYPRYSQIRNSVYFCASDGERFQIFRVNGSDYNQRTRLTDFQQWSARDISIARQNDRMVFELFNEIWRYDETGKASKLPVSISQDLWRQDKRQERMLNSFEAYAISPDDLLVAFKYKYDSFFMPRKGGEVKQISKDQTVIGDMEFLDDKRTLLIQMMDKGFNKLYTVKCDSTMQLSPLDWFGKDSLDVEGFSKDPSGKWVIRYGDKRLSGMVAVADSNLANIRPLNASRPVSSGIAINSSGNYAVYAVTREDVWMRELWLYDFTTGQHRKIMNDDSWIRSLAWTRDDKSILIGRNNGIYRLDLVPRDEFEYDVDNWREIFATTSTTSDSLDVIDAGEILDITIPVVVDTLAAVPEPEAKPGKEELNIVWEGIDKRLYPIVTETDRLLSVERVISDSTFYYLSDAYGTDVLVKLKQANIYGHNVKEIQDLGKDVNSTSWVGDNLYYLEGGKICWFNLGKRSKGTVTADFDYKYSTSLLNTRVFEQVWGVFGLNFYDPDMHGQDWDNLYKLYHPYAEKARSIDDISSIVNEMIGDVNASHTGFYPRRDENERRVQVAYLGIEFDYSQPLLEGVRVAIVYPDSRLGNYYGMKAGDIITRIDSIQVTDTTSLDKALKDKVGKRVRLGYLSNGEAKEAVLNGLSWTEQRQLYYSYKTGLSRKTVDNLTQGRVGYIHIPAMGNRDYDNFFRELFRDNVDKEALIIDVRGNSGGHIHDQIINLLNRQPYAYSTSRRYSGERIQEPRRVWTRPTILLVDETSFSDGEIFPTVYQELKLGKVIGQPSSGSVIGTWEYSLLDGSSMRLPGSGWYRMDGSNMEGNGVVPDIIIEITPEDEIAGRDTQLLKAIEEIQREIR
jgi:C-terminal processing protease CtpA/Prc/tricorn protease-like protein